MLTPTDERMTMTLADAIIEINEDHLSFQVAGGSFYDPDFGVVDECDVDLVAGRGTG